MSRPVVIIFLIIFFLLGIALMKQNFFATKHLQSKAAIAYWEQEEGFESFKKNVDSFDYLTLFWYHIGAESDILKYEDAQEDEEIISFAHDNGVKVLAVITNLSDYEGATWDSERVEEIITDEENRKKHIEDINDLLQEKNFDGVNIDYEELDTNLRDDFTKFIDELSDELHKDGKIVGVALHPKSGENIPSEDNGSHAQDWEALSQSADHLYIMSYGEHWEESSAGPVASIPWNKRIVNYAKRLNVPLEKFYLGIPFYAMKWNKDKEVIGEGLDFSEVSTLIEKYDINPEWNWHAATPYFRYEEDGDAYEVWYEDARSVEEKIALASKAGLGGVSFWYVGAEDPKVWGKLEPYR